MAISPAREPAARPGGSYAFVVLPTDASAPPGLTVAGRLDRLDLAVPIASRMDLDVLVVSQRLVDAEAAWDAVHALALRGRTSVWVVVDGDGRDRGSWRTWAGRVIGDSTPAGARPEEPATATARNRLVVILGAKGGAGKSFVAGNLSACIARGGVRVSAVDLDFESGDLGMRMGLEPQIDLTCPKELMVGQALEWAAIQRSPHTALWAAPARPELASLATEDAVRAIIGAATRDHACTIVDTPADLDHDSTYIALESAAAAILVTTLNPAMVRQCRVMLELLRRLNFPVREALCVVLNRVRRRSLITVSQASELIGHQAIVALPDVPGVADAEGYHGRPWCAASRGGPLTRQFHLLASRVTGGLVALRSPRPRLRLPFTRKPGGAAHADGWWVR